MNRYRTSFVQNALTRARRAVQKAIREGRLVPSKVCEECGTSSVRIEPAHFNYVELERVRWLCVSCHRRWDRIHPKGADLPLVPHKRKVLTGEANHESKLTEGQVSEILSSEQFYGSGLELAKKFGVSPSAISNIRKGKVWKELRAKLNVRIVGNGYQRKKPMPMTVAKSVPLCILCV